MSPASATRERCVRDIEKLGVELEAQTAKLRETEASLEELRQRHHAAGDAVHDAQGQLMKWATDLQLAQGSTSAYDLDETHDTGGMRRPTAGVMGRLIEMLQRHD